MVFDTWRAVVHVRFPYGAGKERGSGGVEDGLIASSGLVRLLTCGGRHGLKLRGSFLTRNGKEQYVTCGRSFLLCPVDHTRKERPTPGHDMFLPVS
jgi:hypothetical protein